MANRARKTEHSGAKKGRGAYWGRKKDAKRESKKKRRAVGKEDATIPIEGAIDSVSFQTQNQPPRLPYDFIFDFLPRKRIEVKKMFGHQCLYFEGIMVMFLISKDGNPDNGVCLATAKEHIPSLQGELKDLRQLEAYGSDATG